MARVIIGSYLVRYPVGGYQSWMLQWLLGFSRLGHDVYFVEKAAWPNACFDPSTGLTGDDPSSGIRSLVGLFEAHGLGDRWCFVDWHGGYHGLSRAKIEEVFRTADLFIDHMRGGEWAAESQRAQQRVLVDGEPAYYQMQLEQQAAAGRPIDGFDAYYTVGLNVGTPRSTAPTAGLTWKPICDPVLPELFPVVPPPPDARWTTVMSWQAHTPIEFKGVTYGQKDIEFERFIDLPRMVSEPIEVAIAGKNVPRERLVAAGWHLRDSHAATATFDLWREYIRCSLGEFSVAKNVFVQTNSGFFSDRSAAYLASGRPVVLQETGFSEHLPCGSGLFAVKTVDEAADAMRRVAADYEYHSRVARSIAMEHLHATKVLAKFLAQLGL